MEDNQKPNTALKGFSTKLGEYLMFVGSASLIIYFLFRTAFGGTQNIVNMSNNTLEIKSKVDTVLKVDTYIGDKVTLMNEGQQEIMRAIMETQRLVKQTNKEVSSLKKTMNGKVIVGPPPTVNPATNKPASYDKSLDEFFRSRLKTSPKGE